MELGAKIGSGAYATVFRGMYLGTEVAIKRFKNRDPMSFKSFLTEIDVYLSFKGHPNITLFFGGY